MVAFLATRLQDRRNVFGKRDGGDGRLGGGQRTATERSN
jgi:hypothetical protein